jgi:hypothetical protein
MATLETQYREFLKNNRGGFCSFEEWKKINARLIEQELINIKKEQKQHLIDMMKKDEELGLYDEPFKHKVETIPTEEILANRSNAYEFIDFDKQETQQVIDEDFDGGLTMGQIIPKEERMYSEEDVKSAFLDGWMLRDGDLPFPKAKKKWFNEFKKKS